MAATLEKYGLKIFRVFECKKGCYSSPCEGNQAFRCPSQASRSVFELWDVFWINGGIIFCLWSTRSGLTVRFGYLELYRIFSKFPFKRTKDRSKFPKASFFSTDQSILLLLTPEHLPKITGASISSKVLGSLRRKSVGVRY